MRDKRLAVMEIFEDPELEPGDLLCVPTGRLIWRVVSSEQLLGGWRVSLERV